MDAFGTITHDYSTPLIDRMNRQSREWYRKNRERALEYDAKRNRKPEFSINPKGGRCYGGR